MKIKDLVEICTCSLSQISLKPKFPELCSSLRERQLVASL